MAWNKYFLIVTILGFILEKLKDYSWEFLGAIYVNYYLEANNWQIFSE